MRQSVEERKKELIRKVKSFIEKNIIFQKKMNQKKQDVQKARFVNILELYMTLNN